MTSSVQDFKKQARKTVILPSGLSVEIRKIRLMDFLDLGELPLPSSGIEENGEGPRSESASRSKKISAAEIQRFSSRAIVSGSIAPKFTDQDDEEHSETLVHVRDLSWDDFRALAGEILEWSGHKKEVAAEAESFRAYGLGEDSPGAGEGILEWSGHKKEVAAEAESFRAYGLGEDSPGAGEGIRQAADRDPANGSRGILFESTDNVPRGTEEKK